MTDTTSTSSTKAPDVIVIGAGLIGCSIAFRLAQAHLSVTIVERSEPGAEASGAAGGMIAPQGEMITPGPFFDLCTSSRDLYPDFVSEIKDLTGEDVGYHREGTLLVALTDNERSESETIYRAQKALNLPIEFLDGDMVRKRVSGLSSEIQCGLFVQGDHWLDNMRLTSVLADACRRLGVDFRCGKAVSKLKLKNSRVESVELEPGPTGPAETLSGGQFVLAAGAWSSELVEPLGINLSVLPCHGQIIEFETPVDPPLVVRAGHHYLVPRPPGRLIAGTTAEYVGYEKTVTAEGLQSIIEGVARFAPFVKKLRFRSAWAGLRPDTADHLPILGRGEVENLYFATGHFRNGILLAPATAGLITELILTGSTSQLIDAYRPTRFVRHRSAI